MATRRGRPPHPDILTPREWEVLALLREALSDEEIAERLGISLHGAKYHVREILSKLQVSSRYEAAAWRPHEPHAWTRFAALPLIAKAGGLAVVAAAVAGLLALAIGVVSGRDGSEAQDGPRINDHWHASYTVTICGKKQPNFPEWHSGVRTEADGVIHIQPLERYEEGSGASLGKFFEYAGGELTLTSIALPGSGRTVSSGDTCPDGRYVELNVFVNEAAIEDWVNYIPKDGDNIAIRFGRMLPECPPGQGCPAPQTWELLGDYRVSANEAELVILSYGTTPGQAGLVYAVVHSTDSQVVEPPILSVGSSYGPGYEIVSNALLPPALGVTVGVLAFQRPADAGQALSLTVHELTLKTPGGLINETNLPSVEFVENIPGHPPTYTMGMRIAPENVRVRGVALLYAGSRVEVTREHATAVIELTGTSAP